MKRFVFIFFLLISVSDAMGQQISSGLLQKAEALYERGDYLEAVAWLHTIHGMLDPVPRLTPLPSQTRARVYFDLGSCYLAAGDTAHAEHAFRRAFVLDSGLKRGHFQNANPGTFWQDLLRQKEAARRAKTTRLGAMMRSFAIPGWGQLYRGHKKKAVGLMGASISTAFVWFVQYYSFKSARSDYEAATRPLVFGIKYPNDDGSFHSEFEARHRVVESRARSANRTLAILGAIWFLGLSDSFTTGPAQVNFTFSF